MKYIGEYYHTKIGAMKALNEWQIKMYKEIGDRGDEILKDTSNVYKKLVWSKPKDLNGFRVSYETNIKKWFIFHGIYTKSMVDDLLNHQPIDVEAELSELLKVITNKI
jgi:hypothetical protein